MKDVQKDLDVVRLIFPALSNLTLIREQDLIEEIKYLDSLYEQPYACFGVDHKIQYYIETTHEDAQSRKVFYRLSQEPILLGAWKRLEEFNFDCDAARMFASLMGGAEVAARTKDIWALGLQNIRVVFESRDDEWIKKVEAIRGLGLSPIVEAIVVYCRIVFSHPFRDGNGRFARAALYGSLARHTGLRSPCLGIGSTFDRYRQELAAATVQLSLSGEWPPYLELVASIIQNGCKFSQHVRRNELTALAH